MRKGGEGEDGEREIHAGLAACGRVEWGAHCFLLCRMMFGIISKPWR